MFIRLQLIPLSGNLEYFFCTTIAVDGSEKSVEREADEDFSLLLLFILLSFSNGEGGGIGMGPLVASSTHFFNFLFL